MKSIYVNQIQVGEEMINEPFLLEDVVRRKTRDGRPYLLCIIRDRSGQMNGVYWDVPEYVDEWVRPGKIALLSGRANSYKNAIQINITDLNQGSGVDASELLPSSQRTKAEMMTELQERIGSLAEPYQALVSHMLLNEETLEKFANSPAARMMHHAYIGGLLEHTLSMAAVADMLVNHYPYVDKDLLISGVLLHDLGKIKEYAIGGSFDFSDDGRLTGHIVLGIIMVEKAAAEVDFPQEQRDQLIHLIASHHGRLEWGSPVKPKTIEAILLHQIDLLDSRVQGFYDHLRNDASQEKWTLQKSPMHETELLRPAGYDGE